MSFDSRRTDIIGGVDQTNTQAGRNAQNLQPGASQTQGSTSELQNGSGAGLSSNDASNILNSGHNSENLSVGVASAGSQTSTLPVAQTASNNSGFISPALFLTLLFAFLAIVLVLAYRRIKKFDEDSEKANAAEAEVLEELTWVTKAEKKKKRRKPKKPHHH